MVFTKLTCNIFRRLELLNLAGVLIYNGIAERLIYGFNVYANRFRHEAARASPESTNADESLRDLLLMFLVKILAEITGRSHVPRYEVFTMRMEPQMFRAVRFGDLMPLVSHELVKPGGTMGESEKEVEVGNLTCLEL